MGVRAAASSERRLEILDAALTCFLERGFAATTIEDIRDRSGASTGSIYHHFGGKEELAAAVYLGALGAYQDGFARTLGKRSGAKEGIQALVRYHVRWIVENPDRARFLFRMRHVEGVRSVEPAISQMNQRLFQRVAEWAEPHLRAGRLARHRQDVWYALCLGPSQEFGRLWLAGRTETSPERAAIALAEAAWRALRGGGGRRET